MARPQGEFYEKLGQRIRTARTNAGLTQDSVAAIVDMTRTSITNIEKGRQPVHVHVLATLAEALHCECGELIPRAGLPDEHFLATELANFPPDERQWISRVISSSPEDSDGSKVSSRKKKG